MLKGQQSRQRSLWLALVIGLVAAGLFWLWAVRRGPEPGGQPGRLVQTGASDHQL